MVGDEIRPTDKAFDVILAGDHGAVSDMMQRISGMCWNCGNF